LVHGNTLVAAWRTGSHGERTIAITAFSIMSAAAGSPMGEALMKARVGDTVKVKAPRGTNEFKIMKIVG
jgi:transcription elongation GreA/GreB family factor